MTSSLVGSEMCIRDRKSTLKRTDLITSLTDVALRVGCGMAAKFNAVSYTHLTLPTMCSV
eukprot:4401101-Prorocentrum_lima.AAC.1